MNNAEKVANIAHLFAFAYILKQWTNANERTCDQIFVFENTPSEQARTDHLIFCEHARPCNIIVILINYRSMSFSKNEEIWRMAIISIKWVQFISVEVILWDMDENVNSVIRPCTFLPPSEIIAILQISSFLLNDIDL